MIHRSSAAFFSSMPVLLSVSLSLLTYRCLLHSAAIRVEQVLDRNPDVQSFLGRLSSSGPADVGDSGRLREPHYQNQNRRRGYPRRPRGRPPFLHLTRAGTLDDDFSDVDSGFRRQDEGLYNSSMLLNPSRLLHLGSAPGKRSWLAGDLRIRILDRAASPVLILIPDEEETAMDESSSSLSSKIEIRIFGQGFHLERRDAMALAYLMTLFSGVYLFATVGFLSLYSCAVGIVFLAVAEFFLGRRRRRSPLRTIYAGSCLGIRRALVFVFLRWVVRDVLAQFLCVLFFSDVRDQQSVLKLFMRVKLVPFLLTASPLTQWSGGDERGLWWFLLAWGMLERVVAVAFAFSCWAAVADPENGRRGPEVLWEGLRQVMAMGDRAFLLRQLEMMVCWNAGRWLLASVGGRLFAGAVQSVAEVFFMVVWLVCYLDMRSREARLGGRSFGSRNLEDSIRGLG